MLHRLNNELIKHKELIIAFSGGVDSAFLASVALKLKEVKVTGILLDTPLMKRSEKESALRVAEEIGLNLVVIAFNPTHIEGINTNSRERCYICKKAMIDKIKEYIAEKDSPMSQSPTDSITPTSANTAPEFGRPTRTA